MAKLKPNSPEWLAALQKVHKEQAETARSWVLKLGREDICSVCGDQPASDFQVGDAALLLRLCKECVMIREFQGEALTPARD